MSESIMLGYDTSSMLADGDRQISVKLSL